MKRSQYKRLSRAKHLLASDLHKLAGKLKETTRVVAASASHMKHAAAGQLSDSFSEIKTRSKAYMHEKPVKSLGMAALAGLFLGLVMRR